MPRLVITLDGVIVKEAALDKELITIGRRPYNDVVIENLAVSGEHAMFHLSAGQVEIEDRGSTNGTLVNGQSIQRQVLRHGDTIEMGKYRIRFLADAARSPSSPPVHSAPPPAPATPLNGVLQVISGPAAGREVALVKVVTTIGRPGVAVSSITKKPHAFVLTHIEGEKFPTLNGEPIGTDPVTLQDNDLIALAGTEMKFVQR